MRYAMFILYVSDQAASMAFYRRMLSLEPDLHVPGMTEFRLTDTAVLGLMPEAGIRRLLGPVLPDPGKAAGVPRAELYLPSADPAATIRSGDRLRTADSASSGPTLDPPR